MILGLFSLLFLLFLLFLPLLAVFLFFRLVTVSFVKLGVPPWAVLLIFSFCLLGSLINISVWHDFPTPPSLYFQPPPVYGRVIAVNLGGCLIPSLLALYVLRRAQLPQTLITVGLITLMSYFVATPTPGVGITMPFFITPLASAGLALILTRGRNAAPVAYVSGVFGTLIGADLLHLSELPTVGILSIGGAGVFDGIFLTGIIAAFLS